MKHLAMVALLVTLAFLGASPSWAEGFNDSSRGSPELPLELLATGGAFNNTRIDLAVSPLQRPLVRSLITGGFGSDGQRRRLFADYVAVGTNIYNFGGQKIFEEFAADNLSRRAELLALTSTAFTDPMVLSATGGVSRDEILRLLESGVPLAPFNKPPHQVNISEDHLLAAIATDWDVLIINPAIPSGDPPPLLPENPLLAMIAALQAQKIIPSGAGLSDVPLDPEGRLPFKTWWRGFPEVGVLTRRRPLHQEFLRCTGTLITGGWVLTAAHCITPLIGLRRIFLQYPKGNCSFFSALDPLPTFYAHVERGTLTICPAVAVS